MEPPPALLNASASSQSLCHEMFLTLPDFAGTVTRPRAPSVDVAAARSSSPLSGVGLSRCALGKRHARNHLWRGRNNSLHLCGCAHFPSMSTTFSNNIIRLHFGQLTT